MLGLTFSSKLDWGSYIISISKTSSKEIGAFICSVKFLSPELDIYIYISLNQPYSHTWSTVVMSGLMLIDATWNY